MEYERLSSEIIDSVVDNVKYLTTYHHYQRMLLRGVNSTWFCPMHLTLRGLGTRMQLVNRRSRLIITCDYTGILSRPLPRKWMCNYPCMSTVNCIHSNLIVSSIAQAISIELDEYISTEVSIQLRLEKPITPKFAAARLSLFVERLKEGTGRFALV